MTPDPPRRVLVVEHQPDAPAGVLGDWLTAAGAAVDVWRPAREAAPPDPGGYDLVASLGSEHAVYDGPAWIATEQEMLRRADAAGTPVLGICFGAQILAAALGGRVAAARSPEIGWIPIDSDDPRRLPVGPWMSWHSDAFVPPPGAEVLARTAVGPHAFRLRGHLGVQFHPEATPGIVDGWIATGAGRLDELGIDPEGLRRASRAHAPAARALALRLFEAHWEGLSGRS